MLKPTTGVVDVILNGAVPVATVEVIISEAESVVNFPDAAVVPPTAELSIVPPVIDGVEIIGEVKVLFVSVWVKMWLESVRANIKLLSMLKLLSTCVLVN